MTKRLDVTAAIRIVGEEALRNALDKDVYLCVITTDNSSKIVRFNKQEGSCLFETLTFNDGYFASILLDLLVETTHFDDNTLREMTNAITDSDDDYAYERERFDTYTSFLDYVLYREGARGAPIITERIWSVIRRLTVRELIDLFRESLREIDICHPSGDSLFDPLKTDVADKKVEEWLR